MADTAPGAYPRLTDAAVEHAKARLGISDLDALWRELGFASRMTFWRARNGLYDIRLSHAQRICDQLGWPMSRVFERDTDA